MSNVLQKCDERRLNNFVAKEWIKVLSFLNNRFGIGDDDCKDIFQESFIIMYTNIQAGKLESMTASLSTYFISICINKAHEFLRRNKHSVNIDSETSLSLMDGQIKSEKIKALIALDDSDFEMETRKEELVRSIVRQLPHPCDKLLWGFYRDNLSLKTLAGMFNYSSESSVKVTKHRCCEKFRARYNELYNKLF